MWCRSQAIIYYFAMVSPDNNLLIYYYFVVSLSRNNLLIYDLVVVVLSGWIKINENCHWLFSDRLPWLSASQVCKRWDERQKNTDGWQMNRDKSCQLSIKIDTISSPPPRDNMCQKMQVTRSWHMIVSTVCSTICTSVSATALQYHCNIWMTTKVSIKNKNNLHL